MTKNPTFWTQRINILNNSIETFEKKK